MKIVTTKTMKEMDRKAMEEYHIPGVVLMEHAAMAVKKHVDLVTDKKSQVVILCGPGNNGGDGFALARLLKQDGYEYVTIFCNVAFEKMSHDEKIFAAMAGAYHIPIYQSEDLKEVKKLLASADIVVDALFGTGLSRNIEGFYDQLILALNTMHKYVISIDIASGINGDSGAIMGCGIQATKTISLVCYKPGNVMYPGSAYCGEVVVEDIAMPKDLITNSTGNEVMDDRLIASFLPKRKAHSHKGSYGKALMIGGSMRMHGALAMCAKAALSSGIGTLTIALPKSIHAIMAGKMEECMLLPLSEEDGYFSKESAEELKQQIDEFDFVSIGNGMGRGSGASALVEMVLHSKLPCILDGDALYIVGKHPEWLKRKAVTILTPHPKEMSYLSNRLMDDVLNDPMEVVRTFLKGYENITLIYKNEHTIVCNKTFSYMNLAGNNALAKGGSGDVLCGMLCGLYGQSKDALKSACCAVYVHARCADELIKAKDYNAILANDIIEESSHIYKELRSLSWKNI